MKSQPDRNTNAPHEEKSSSRRGLFIVIGVIVVIAAIIFGIKAYLYASTHETTDDAQVDGNLIAITSKISERIKDITVTTNSFVRRGQVLVVLDDQDERRRLGQAEATLNATRAQAQVAGANVSLTTDQQRAQIAQGQGGVAEAYAGIANAEQQVAQAEDELSVSRANVATARAQRESAIALAAASAVSFQRSAADLHRLEQLARTGDASTSDLDTARASAANADASKTQADANIRVADAALASARDKLSAQQAAVTAAEAGVRVQQAQLQTAQGKQAEVSSPFRIQTERSSEVSSIAQVATQKSAVSQAKDQLEYTVIRAPVDGYIGEKDAEIGKTVAPGETILTVVPSSGLFVTANYKETQVGRIHPRQRVEINIDAYNGREISGYVEALPPASQATYSLIPAQNSTGNFVKVTQRLPVRIMVDSGIDHDHPLRVGMSVETSVVVK